MSTMRHELSPSHGKARLDRRLDRLFGSARIYTDLFLDRTFNEGKCRRLPGLSDSA